jgi:hypothetical protein
MASTGVAADYQDAGSVFDFVDRISHSTAAETGGQTGHRGGMSETGTVVHIVGLHYHAGELLRQIIFFIGTLS